ncbi:MAG TPA: response regulator [Spirochaetia bacterium]|nr:response regulator [Spirochaetia bacterium]
MTQVILCIEDEQLILHTLVKEVQDVVGDAVQVEGASGGRAALDVFDDLLGKDGEFPIAISDYLMPDVNGDEVLAEIHRRSPMTKTILLTGKANIEGVGNAVNRAGLYHYITKPWEREDLALTVKEALKSYRQEKDLLNRLHDLEDERSKVLRERKVIDTLSRILTDKIEELEKQKGELEEVSKELNITTVEKLLIEQEAEKMSRLLSSLQNNLKNNLFIRSVLHSLVNMLQIQFSIDKRENRLVDEIRETVRLVTEKLGQTAPPELVTLNNELLPRISYQRKKTELNVHKSLTGYVKAVQRSLLGESVYFSAKPTNLTVIVSRVRQKYREILEDKKRGLIRFTLELHQDDVHLCVFDFALITIIENLLTNSIRKVLESKKTPMWIKLVTFEERIRNDVFTMLKWMDSGTGVEENRKKTIFEGDSDKTEEGDHGVGLSDIRNTVESVGGFVRETGVYGEGAVFLLGFPKVEKAEEIDFDKEIEEEQSFVFPKEMQRKAVFIVEDHINVARDLREFLQNAGIRKVEIFSSGKKVLDRLQETNGRPDLILTDLEMEPVDGGHLIESLRKRKIEVPVLVVSGMLFKDDPAGYARLIELNKLGVRDVVTKPVDFAELFEKLKRILKNPQAGGR